jgi:murein DD-endopeptidase MepM/ murein hydrolase activator NlpD
VRPALASTLALLACCLHGCNTIVLSEYGTRLGVHRAEDGSVIARDRRNRGVDFRAVDEGDPVLAAADGVVLRTGLDDCGGVEVVVRHVDFDRTTRYTRLRETYVEPGDVVERGKALGEVGMFRCSAGIVHVHMELWLYGRALHDARRAYTNELSGTLDPLPISDGCFERSRQYRDDQLVLTYPVDC